MSRLLARIMLALLMLPLGALVYMVTLVALMEFVPGYRREVATFLVAGTVTAAFVAGYWVLLWRGVVRWSSWRIGLTVAAGLVAVAVGGGLAAILWSTEETFAAFVWSVTAILVWLVLTVFTWRETAAERSAGAGVASTVRCPACGYNLTGLARCTCPECGATYRLEELILAHAEDDELCGAGGAVPGRPRPATDETILVPGSGAP